MVEQVVTDPPVETKPEGFLDGISPEFHSALEGFTDKNGLAKGYSELFTKMGSYVKLPTDESTPEEKSSFYQKQGCPDTPEGYTLPDLPEGKTYDKEFVGSLSIASHKAGITNTQFAEQVKAYLIWETQQAELAEGERVRAEAESDGVLKAKWGAEYPANVVLVQRACDELITDNEGKPDTELHDAFAALIEEKGLKNNPVFAQVFCKIGQKMLDDTFVKGGGLPEGDKDYVPHYKDSPDMYASGDDEESKKARAYFRAKGHEYARQD